MRWINRRPDRSAALALAALPFIVALAAYFIGSEIRLAQNPGDKIMPALTSFIDAVRRMAFTVDPRTGSVLLWTDTLASLSRLATALLIATGIAVALGLSIGVLPIARAALSPFLAVVCMTPPLALLPLLFIVAGLGEESKIALIVIGVAPFLARDLALRVAELPAEQVIKAQTLGASTWQIALRIVLPQMSPRIVDAMRLSLGPAWLFLIAAEAIAAESGLGYRIFLVRRFLAMDVIIPYVAWITLLAFLMDFSLGRLQRRAFPWFFLGRAG